MLITLEAIARADGRVALLIGDRIIAHLTPVEAQLVSSVPAEPDPVVETPAIERRPVKKRAAKKAAAPIGAEEPPRQRRKYTRRAPPTNGTVQLSQRPIVDDLEETRAIRGTVRLPKTGADDGLDMERIEAVVQEARTGRTNTNKNHPDRIRAKELGQAGKLTISEIAAEVGRPPQTVIYWREADDWDGHRAARMNGERDRMGALR